MLGQSADPVQYMNPLRVQSYEKSCVLRLTKYPVRQNDRILKADVEAWLPWDCLSQIVRDVAVTLRVYDYPRHNSGLQSG